MVHGTIVSLGEDVGDLLGRSPDSRRVRPGCRNGRTRAAGDVALALVRADVHWAIGGGMVLRGQARGGMICVERTQDEGPEVGRADAWSAQLAVATLSQKAQSRPLYSPTPPPPPQSPCIRRRGCQ